MFSKIVKKGEMWSLDVKMLPGSRIKKEAKLPALLPTCLDTALSRKSCILLHNSCTFETEITSPSESYSEATVSKGQSWYEKYAALYPKWYEQLHQCQYENLKDSDQSLMGSIQSMLSGDEEAQNQNATR